MTKTPIFAPTKVLVLNSVLATLVPANFKCLVSLVNIFRLANHLKTKTTTDTDL